MRHADRKAEPDAGPVGAVLVFEAAVDDQRLLAKTTEARDLITSVYPSFTEGFDTVDLKEAKALLEMLS